MSTTDTNVPTASSVRSRRACRVLRERRRQERKAARRIRFAPAGPCGASLASDELGLSKAFFELAAKMLSNPYRLAETQMNLMWDYSALWQSSMLRLLGQSPAPVVEPAKGDKRFRHEDWQEHFLFDYVKQSYLIAARWLHKSVASVEGLDEHTQKKIDFFTRQYIDALAPSNFALTNPEVFRETVATGGQNLVKGLNNLLDDIERGNGKLKISMTDTKAFELGVNIATTPGKVVFQNDLDAAHPVRADDGQGLSAAAADHAAVDQQVLHPRPAREELAGALGVEQGLTVFVDLVGEPGRQARRQGLRRLHAGGPARRPRRDREGDRRARDQRTRLLPGRHVAGRDAWLHDSEKGQAHRQRQLHDVARRFRRQWRAGGVHRRGAGSVARAQDERARLSRGFGDGEHVQHAAQQRSDLVVRHQQLPAWAAIRFPSTCCTGTAIRRACPPRCTASICATCT